MYLQNSTYLASTAAGSSFMARIRNSIGLEVAKVSLLRTILQPGEYIVGTLDFRASSLAAAAAFGMNYPALSIETSCDNDRNNNSELESKSSIDPYVCSEYSVSLVAKENIVDSNDNSESIDQSKLSLDVPPCSSNKLLKSTSMEQISSKTSPSKTMSNHTKNETETIQMSTADVVLGTDAVGFKLQVPKQNSVPTFNSSIGNIQTLFLTRNYKMI